jgi:hypothetical protein
MVTGYGPADHFIRCIERGWGGVEIRTSGALSPADHPPARSSRVTVLLICRSQPLGVVVW